jgi:hypothetical protein
MLAKLKIAAKAGRDTDRLPFKFIPAKAQLTKAASSSDDFSCSVAISVENSRIVDE